MLKAVKIIIFLHYFFLISCSYIQTHDIATKKEEGHGRRLASYKNAGCKDLLSSYLDYAQKQTASISTSKDITKVELPFSLRPKFNEEEASIDEVMVNALKSKYPGVYLEVIKNHRPGVQDYKSFRIAISRHESFLVESFKKHEGGKKEYRLIYSGNERSVNQNFYYDSLSVFLNKNMINLKLGDLKGISLFEKLRTDLVVKNLTVNIKLLNKFIGDNGTNEELVPLLEVILSNVKAFKDDIYLTKDEILIGHYLDLNSELTHIYQVGKHNIKRQKRPTLNKIQKHLEAISKSTLYENILERKKIIRMNEAYYANELEYIQGRMISTIPSIEFESYFQQFIFLKKMKDKSSVYSHLQPEIDFDQFYLWYRNRNSKIISVKKSADDRTMRSYYHELVELYRIDEKKHPSWKIFTPKRDKMMFSRMRGVLEKGAAESYNNAIDIQLSSMSSLDHFKRTIAIAIFNFNAFEPKFNSVGFTHWMKEKGIPSLEEFYKIRKKFPNYTTGEYLMNKYYEYAPYAKFNDKLELPFFKRQVHQLKGRFGKLKSKIKSCHSSGSCIRELIVDNFKELFKKNSWKKRFSCLASQPALFVNVFSDLALFTASTYILYEVTQPERFPWELITTAMTFNILHDEANCRVSKSPFRNFGERVNPEQLMASNKLRRQFKLESLKNLGVTTLYSSMGLTLYSMGFNSLYISMGHPVSEDISWNDAAKMLAFNAAYFTLFSNFVKLKGWLPIRHDFLPKLVKNLQKKFPWHLKNGFTISNLYNRAAESSFYLGMSFINSYLYLVTFKNTVMPWLMKTFSIEIEGFAPMNEEFHNSHVKTVKQIYDEAKFDAASGLWIQSIGFSNGAKTEILYKEKVSDKTGLINRVVVGVDQKIPEHVQDKFYLDIVNSISTVMALDTIIDIQTGNSVKKNQ